MDNRELISLLTQAHEADRFERELLDVGAAPAARRPWYLTPTGLGGGLGLAAAVALAAGLAWHALSPTAPQGGTSVAIGPRQGSSQDPTPNPVSAPGESPSIVTPVASSPSRQDAMLIALFRDADGHGDDCPGCWCVQRIDSDEGGDPRHLDEAGLLLASIEHACVPDPESVFIVGLSGPADLLPHTDDKALNVALCLLDAKKAGDPSLSLQTACLTRDVSVNVAAWSR